MNIDLSVVLPYLIGAIATVLSFVAKRYFTKKAEERLLIQQAAFCHIELLAIQQRALLKAIKHLNGEHKLLSTLLWKGYEDSLLEDAVEIENYKTIITQAKIKLNRSRVSDSPL